MRTVKLDSFSKFVSTLCDFENNSQETYFLSRNCYFAFTSTVISSQRAVTVSSFLIFINCFLTAAFCKGMFIGRWATQVGEVTRLFI